MKRGLLLIMAAATGLLGGCVTPEQLAAQDEYTCNSYGFQYGTPEYGQCRMRVAEQRQQAWQASMAYIAASNERAAQANSQALRDYAATIQTNRPPPPTSSTTTCTKLTPQMATCNTNSY